MQQPENMAVIDAGHYGMEHIFIQYMAGYLKENLPSDVEVVTAPSAWPTVLYNCCLCAADGQCPPVQHAPVFVAEFLPVMPEFQRRMQRSLSEILV